MWVKKETEYSSTDEQIKTMFSVPTNKVPASTGYQIFTGSPDIRIPISKVMLLLPSRLSSINFLTVKLTQFSLHQQARKREDVVDGLSHSDVLIACGRFQPVALTGPELSKHLPLPN